MDVIVVGAGAAGLAAAKTLRGAGLRVAVLEAKHRTGGRAWTDAATFGVPLDWGCHWLHSADVNPFTKMAQTWGFAHRTGTGWGRLHLGERWESDAEHEQRMAFYRRSMAAVEAAAEAGRDVAVAEVVERAHRRSAMFDFWMCLMSGFEPAHVSTLDLARYRDTGENWPVADGYGALVARYGADLEVALGTPARRIDWGGGRGVRVRTARGTLDARAVVVTVSTGVLAAGTLRFEPPLPQWKLAAIDAVPLGYAGKIAFAFDRDVFDLPSTTYAIPERGAPRTLSFQIRPFARSLAVGYVGGHFCRELEAAGEVAMIAFARERLVDMFGAGVPRRIVKSACVRWGEDPDVRGGYSCARPGRAEQRAALARPVGERVFFAGEACSREFFSTAHGALLNGVEVGRAVADYLNGRITRTAQE
ncbi:MAG: FAD-dependent oxidoreductase [Gammaproteobacteria bacterium]|nr:FAD-dependent oxidoreductase [Gammaproteobacteria bacterium]NIR84070.1 FAD-dependent oxidoreductase [Gammaproteobacteria bacterium]NIR89214.1 FAD-dependent oxidoreductase [Gammaproteobacteria bacterium]NIU05016.1 FAD-dependent oxidoreductase [Gammaproteobacteria bacterium]NIV52182.1 NAD(P)-binding protein [Gammaproteobacteria bacterium]